MTERNNTENLFYLKECTETYPEVNMVFEYWFACLRNISAKEKMKLREYFGDAYTLFYIDTKNLSESELLTEKQITSFLSQRSFSFWFDIVSTSLSKEAKKLCQDIIHNENKNDLERNENLESRQSLESKHKPESRQSLGKQFLAWQQWYKIMAHEGIRFIPYFAEDYPAKLFDIASPPYALYLKGKLPDPGKMAVAIVGARTCTPYGENYALKFGEALGQAGIQVISGMARGIDSLGQRGALNSQGTSFAVLGCGVNICYPPNNFGLYRDLQKEGGIISEFIYGTQPLPTHFPSRNRIISALSDNVVVIEAAQKSGSLITADFALEQGRDVYALPGPIDSALSQGCNQLIRQGAGILMGTEEFLDDLEIMHAPKISACSTASMQFSGTEQLIYNCLDYRPKNVNDIARETGLLAKETLENLVTLELGGWAKEISKNYYAKTPKDI